MNSEEDKKKLYSLLKSIAREHGNSAPIGSIDFEALLVVGKELGISKQEFLSLFEQYIALFPHKKEDLRITQFQRLLLLINAYESIQANELEYIKGIAFKLGLHPEGTEMLLMLMKSYPKGRIPRETFYSIFNQFKN